jgi:hypothetical protein
MSASRPKLRLIAFESTFDPSMMNNRDTSGSSPRATRLSISACTQPRCRSKRQALSRDFKRMGMRCSAACRP